MVKKVDGSEHKPVEMTDSAKRKLNNANARQASSRYVGGQAGKASRAISSRQDAAAAARAAADKAMGITRR